MLSVWPDPPQMDVGAPSPALTVEGQQLWVAYRTRREDHFAVLLFSGLEHLSFGPPSGESLSEHPLFAAGLEPYAFFEVPVDLGADLAGRGLKRWIATFHDDLLDVQAATAEVLVSAVEAADAPGALAAIRA